MEQKTRPNLPSFDEVMECAEYLGIEFDQGSTRKALLNEITKAFRKLADSKAEEADSCLWILNVQFPNVLDYLFYKHDELAKYADEIGYHYILTPREVIMDERLKPNAKFLLGLIWLKDRHRKKHCYAGNESLGRAIGLTKDATTRLVENLLKYDYVKNVHPDAGKPNNPHRWLALTGEIQDLYDGLMKEHDKK